MAGNLIGEPINEEILKQIDLRQKMHGSGYNPSSISRDPIVLNYLNNRNAWIKMASSVSISGSFGEDRLKDLQSQESSYITESDFGSLQGIGLAKKGVLFNTIQTSNRTQEGKNAGFTPRSGVRKDNLFANSQDKMYGGLGGNSTGLQPIGGITDITVKSLNRGSIKKATVNLKVYNKFQFTIIETLYLRLGYMMMLEWGWDKYIEDIDMSTSPPNVKVKDTQSTIIENSWFNGQSYTQRQILNKISFYQNKYKGNYGGFFGKVSNFSWTLNKDLSYNITIDLISIGSIIESLKANIPAKALTSNELKSIKKKIEKNLKVEAEDNSIVDGLSSNLLSQWVGTTIADFPLNNKNYLYLPNIVGNDVANKSVSTLRKRIPTTARYFVKLRTFLQKLQTLIIGEYVNGNAKGDLLQIDYSDNNICNYVYNLYPLNIDKAFFSFLFDSNFKKKLLQGKTSYNPTQIKNFTYNFAYQINDNPEVVAGSLMNIYINLNFINQALNNTIDDEGNLSVFDFLKNICGGINECTGGVTNIEPAIKEDNIIYFLEQNPIKGFDSTRSLSKEYPLEIFGYNPNGSSTFVKDFKFQTKITPKLMSMITVSKTAEGSSTKNIDSIPYKNWNKGLKDRFEEKLVDPPTTTDTNLTPQEINRKKIEDAFLWDLKNYGSESPLDYDKYLTTNNYDWKWEGTNIIDIQIPGNEAQGPAEDLANPQRLAALLDEVVRRVEKLQSERRLAANQIGRKLIPVTNFNNSYGGYLQHIIRAWGGDTGTATFTQYRDEGGGGLLKDNKIEYTKQIIPLEDAMFWYGSNSGEDSSESTGDFVKVGQQTFKSYIQQLNLLEFEKSGVNSSLSGFIPVELGLTMEGIDGIKIYNKILINQKFLPSSYPSALKFIIKGVDHKISNNIWETNITTISTTPTENTPSVVKDNSKASTSITNSSTSPTTSTSSGDVVSSYPELPLIDPPPPPNLLPYQEAVQTLNSITTPNIAKAVFAVLFAEASKKGQAFSSAGGFNYAGVQTDVRSGGQAVRWGASQYITARYVRKDAVRLREFAVFENNKAFLEFMVNRITAKGFNGDNGDSWTNTYINKWWSPAKKTEFTKGTTTYNNKLSIYNSSLKRYDQYS